MSAEQMNRIIACWALAECRSKHLCAFETLGLNARCRKPTQLECKKAWQRLCRRFHPDKHMSDALATEATRCLNLAKQYLDEDFFGDAEARVAYKHRSTDSVVVVPVEPSPSCGSPPTRASPTTTGKRPTTEAPDPGADLELPSDAKQQRCSAVEMSVGQTETETESQKQPT